MRRGFLLGKFMPTHAGHLFLCEAARARVDQLTVLLCSHDAEPIPGNLRADWMRECLAGTDIRLLHMHRDIPQEPADHPDFWAIWRAAIVEHHPEPIDWVFGSEDYVASLAKSVGAHPFIVDQGRQAVPVSASMIRTNPVRHWDRIPMPVRGYFQKRLTLLGPESAGKTTMAETLARELGAGLIPEYGRQYDALMRQGSGWSADDFAAIIEGHLALGGAISRRAAPLVIEDTDPVQTLVWAEYLLGTLPAGLARKVQSMPLPDHYLLLDHQTGWHDDGTRYSGAHEVRAWFTGRLAYWLDRIGADWTLIDQPDWADRLTRARAAALGIAP
ncbi:MAG: AAA family ATPase [Paracoccus sp. (in: a-proteobacteria)]